MVPTIGAPVDEASLELKGKWLLVARKEHRPSQEANFTRSLLICHKLSAAHLSSRCLVTAHKANKS